MKLHIYNPYSNITVTKEYVNTIAQAFKNNGYEVVSADKLVKQNPKEKISALVIVAKDAIAAKRLGYNKVYLWVQGIVPEESYMRHHSKLRYFMLGKIENQGLKSADFIFYVSEAMKEHFKNKYKFSNEHNYVMPCFNSEIDSSAFATENKYNSNLFLYAGGLDPWQCFEKTVGLYAEIEKRVDNAELRVLTKNSSLAEDIIKKHGVKHYSIDFKPVEQVKDEMKKAKFGFSLRDQHPVNYVSTPTKLSTYVSYGVIPVYSKNTADFASHAENKSFAVRADNDNQYGIEKIVSLCNASISPQEVLDEFTEAFGKYYNRDYHVKIITEILRKEN